jgi:plasmid maintenance system antidote protein VapI
VKSTPSKPKTKLSRAAAARIAHAKRVGEIILTAIHDKGLNITSFAKSIEVEPSTVSRWCAGLRFPGRDMLRMLVEKLGIEPSALL